MIKIISGCHYLSVKQPLFLWHIHYRIGLRIRSGLIFKMFSSASTIKNVYLGARGRDLGTAAWHPELSKIKKESEPCLTALGSDFYRLVRARGLEPP